MKHFPGGGPQETGLDPHFTFGKNQVYPAGNFGWHLKPWKAAIDLLMKMQKRAEQQALSLHGLNFVIDEYLPTKLKQIDKQATAFGFRGTPYTVVVNKRGEIVARIRGRADEARLRVAQVCTALYFAFFLLMPLYTGLIGGDLMAKEAEDGTLRMILSRPISRFRLLLVKWLAGLCFSAVLVMVPWACPSPMAAPPPWLSAWMVACWWWAWACWAWPATSRSCAALPMTRRRCMRWSAWPSAVR